MALAATASGPRFGGLPMTLALLTTSDSATGAADRITTGAGEDVILGGAGADTIGAGDGANVVLGDNGLVDWTAAERGGTLPGDDADASDIDRIRSLDPAIGGDDAITTGAGADTIAGGAGADTIGAGAGDDLILGDAGWIDAGPSAPRGHVISIATDQGAGDTIAAGAGRDTVIGGIGDDRIDAGEDNDVVAGDNAELRYALGILQVLLTIAQNDGGTDTLLGGAGQDLLVGGAAGDFLDGGAGEDLIFGDEVSLLRRVGDISDPRFEALLGTVLYQRMDLGGALLVDGIARPYRDSSAPVPEWALFQIVDLFHSAAIAGAAVPAGKVATYGSDVIAGGAGDDVVFGQLGDDVLLGDGALADGPAGAWRTSGGLDPLGPLVLSGSVERATDGDDYIEGGGGDDVIFGGLGQDDLIGGSSSLYGLTTPGQRPDGDDYIFGGAGTRTGYDAVTTDLADAHSRDADVIVGNIVRIVGTLGRDAGGFLAYTSDVTGGRRIVVRGVTPLDPATPGDDEVHGESGDDQVYGGGGADRIFGDAGDDDLIGGAGDDWISGGTGDDGVLGDDGHIFTFRDGTPEPLYSIVSGAGASGVLTKITDVAAGAVSGTVAGGDDVIYGGLGDDVLRGGAGDDAISGAEAPLEGYAADMIDGGTTRVVRSDWTRPYNPGDLLHYGPHSSDPLVLARFAMFDPAHPYTKVLVNGQTFFLAVDPGAGPKLPGATVPSDGADTIVGDAGNDWLVGGTGRDGLWGGIGDDLLDADDDPGTDGGLNIRTDDNPDYADHADGGAGRDILLGNNARDVLTDTDGNYDDLNAGWIGSGMPVGNPGGTGGGLIGGQLGSGSSTPGAGLLPGTGSGKSAGTHAAPGSAPTKLSAAARTKLAAKKALAKARARAKANAKAQARAKKAKHKKKPRHKKGNGGR
jgi:Ca2+-binding RTX toxin-like protein